MKCGASMVASYYRKTKPETKLKNREEYKKLYSTEIEWLKENLFLLKDDKFMIDMYTILVTGSRKMSPKMIEAVRRGVNSPQYDTVAMIERQEKIKPILEKIQMVLELVKEMDEGKDDYYIKNYSPLSFVTSIMNQLKTRGKLSEKQMAGLNKVYKKYMKMKENKDV
jgi:pheromone shutdown protein TraB